MYRRAVAMASIALASTDVAADPVPQPPAREAEATSSSRRVLAVAAAIFPGVIVHGAGAYVAGDKTTAKRLLLAELPFAGAVGIGGGLVKGTGASGYVVEPSVPLLVGGLGGLLAGWFSDIWVAAGGSPHGERIADPRVSVELGLTHQHDAYRERGYARLAATAMVTDRFTVGTLGLLDAENHARLAEANGKIRFLESESGYLDIKAAARYQRDDPDDVSVSTLEATVGGRLDLQWLDPLLAGTFAEISTGLGLQRVGYAKGEHDLTSRMLGTFAYGVYLGRAGEIGMFYDHRRDSLAGGLAAWRAAGFVGSFGANLLVHVSPEWALHAQFEVGNAYVTTLALQYRRDR